ncbi:peptidoglycan-binding protein, partial [Candidatus Parcubacteria bacterium]|nr:peptidoglycan-binding protein [Candidatus Parcubacteria bacterium]
MTKFKFAAVLATGMLTIAFLVPNITSAAVPSTDQIIRELQAKIVQLQAQIRILQNQTTNGGTTVQGQTTNGTSVVGNQPGFIGPPVAYCPPGFAQPLTVGSNDANTGNQVSAIQQILSQDKEVYPEGLVTGYFGLATQRAVQRYQRKHGIVSSGDARTTGYGVIGKVTFGQIVSNCRFDRPMPPVPGPGPTNSLTVTSPNGGETSLP